MGSDYTVVDVDAHFLEALDEFSEYMEEPWKTRFTGATRSRFIPGSTGDRNVAGRIMRQELESYRENTAFGRVPKISPEQVPAMMRHVGLDKIVLLPNHMLSFGKMASDEYAVPLANGHVDWMLDRVVDPDEGIYTMAVLPYQDPGAAVEMIDRVKDERAVVGLCLITAGPEPPLGDRKYDEIYEAIQASGLPAVFHSGGSSIDDFYIRGYRKFVETHALGFLWNNMAQAVSLVIQGVPEKFPDMDIVFQESGVFWVPTMMHRLDTGYLKRQSEAPLLERRPSKYMREFYYGTQPLEVPENLDYLQQVVEMIGGPDQLMYASDYPHWDYDRPSVITDLEFLDSAGKAKILGGNAEEVFDLG